MAMNDVISRLSVSLSMDTAAFQRGATIAEKRASAMQTKMASVGTTMKGVGAAIGATVIIDGLSNMAMKAFDMASSLSEAAQQVGVSVEALQELRFAAEQSGIGADKMDATIKKLNKSLGDLQLGKKGATAAFEAIGLSADELRGKSPDQALRIIADELNKIPDAATRVAIGSAIMGKGFSELRPLIEGGSAAFDGFAKQAHQNGIVTTEQAARLDDLADYWDKLKARVGVASAIFIADVIPAVQATGRALDNAKAVVDGFYAGVASRFRDMVTSASNMVTGIRDAVVGRLTAIWNTAIAKVEAVKNAFWNMWDRITRRSYVPDMVDDIEREMRRLDGVMVKPATKATDKVTQAMRDMADETKGILDKLFPEIRKGLEFEDLITAIDRQLWTPEQKAEAKRRAHLENAGMGTDAPNAVTADGLILNQPMENFQSAVESVLPSLTELEERAGVTATQVVKSFQEMAEATLRSINQMIGAIKGGGFLDILNAVVNLGLQLASIGAFGKKAQTKVNAPKVPENANGTRFFKGGLSLVGERGPELVGLPKGSRVWPSGTGPGPGPKGGGGGVMEVRPSPLFEVYVDGKLVSAAPHLMQGGAQIAHSQTRYRNTRRVA